MTQDEKLNGFTQNSQNVELILNDASLEHFSSCLREERIE
mgnify:CR=1 FL=1